MFNHFLEAQEPVYEQVLRELRGGRKETHWMWFIFPQLAGLGHSEMAKKYAIKDEQEAKLYWEHPILGARLRECMAIVEQNPNSPHSIFSGIDAIKYESCKKIFAPFHFEKIT